MLLTHCSCFRKLSFKLMSVVLYSILILVAWQFVLFNVLAVDKFHYIKRRVMGKTSSPVSPVLITEAEAILNDENNPIAQDLVSRSNTSNSTIALQCPQISPLLGGRKNVSKVPPTSMEELESAFKKNDNVLVEPGGRYKPAGCLANHRVAIIIPFRNREEHLLLFLQHMHPFLQRQQIEYGIFVIEQSLNTAHFNKATLMNIGVVEVLKRISPPFQCFIFHDVDLLPEDDRNIYSCMDDRPKHLSVAIDTLKYKLKYDTLFGGVIAMTKEHFFLVNGFSNFYWGWGGEDDDMFERVRYHKLKVFRLSSEIARYTMLPHKKSLKNWENVNYFKTGKLRFSADGLNSLNYTLLEFKVKPLYTHVVVDLLNSPKSLDYRKI